MKLLRKIKNLFGIDNVEFIENTCQKHPEMEADVYLLVQTGGEDTMLFTKYQIRQAQARAKKHPEDIYICNRSTTLNYFVNYLRN